MANLDVVRGQTDDERTTCITFRSRRPTALQEIHDPLKILMEKFNVKVTT